mmetsp:Transcript_113907/g.332848  ORF Transcript_113907/g.332848 Transcript_113907/m.332848 type:complete len:359 (-) Transcript_113907:43-1119(-)
MTRDGPGPSGHGASGALLTFMVLMLMSGSCNTLLMKFMVMQQAPTGFGARSEGFNHPYFQSLLMMIGEFLCLLAYLATREPRDAAKTEQVPKHVFMVACLLDWTATTLVNMAYVLIPASIVQMTRGAIVIFTCLFSVLFLRRRQHRYHVAGVVFVFAGITLVSLSALISPAASTAAASGTTEPLTPRLTGIALCIGAQVFQASMLVYEEKIMSRFSIPPLQVVGMEGTCGIFVGILLLGVLNALSVESTSVALYQMTHSTPLMAAVLGSIVSIAVFNYSGVTVTQQASAVARSTIDVSRTILIWVVELSLHWNHFSVLQLLGFAVLAVGTLIYNRLIVVQALEPPPEATPALEKPTAA